MRDLHLIEPTQVELQNDLYDEWKKALRQYWFSRDLKEAGGQKQWSVIAIFEMCKTLPDGQTLHERRFNSPFEGPIILFGAEVKFDPISAKDQSRVHQFGTDTEDLKTMPPAEIH